MNEMFASLYELLFYDPVLSRVLYDESKYFVFGIISLISVLLFAIVYYKGLDRPKFTYFRVWLLVMLLCIAANFGIVFALTDPLAEQNNLGQDVSLGVALAHIVWVFAFYLLSSIGLKFISVNHSKIPF